ncbi:hypothetical protein DO021_19665 [Desulfobacter hydrogenophilus]|uniref:Uncharacterized protein n=1 Tax=Desulfobacter hydrogenophilus TaxID=2291 RepID=A0A328F813_9BACT|nr:hypothetical protein [Desulfobacter hydrogenophilus]NDY73989.1 hypothetical protein [Desulfobacter hydrogenophilus]QBH14334.1 hypothetical protein EYB58_16265 [Desulfobacter hydrogenophilus]RAM00336.1 hypothetical protein DO021_19665 [Desulfobacter hydrogenophilus]
MNITGIRTRLIIGGQEYLRIPEMSLDYRRHAPLSVAQVTLADPGGDIFKSLSPGTAMEIHLGYRDQEADVWTGTVQRVTPDRKPDQVRMTGVGGELPLSETLITKSWENETPEAIVTYCVGQTGLPPGNIDATGIIFPRFVAATIPVWQVARQCEHSCHRGFGRDMDTWDLWMDKAGSVHWGDSDEDGDIPVIATAGGVISHAPATAPLTELSMVETFLLPGFRRCGKFQLTDTRRGIDDVFRARVVRHVVQPNKIRTYIWYGAEYGKY